MTGSIAETDAATAPASPDRPFAIEPNDATRATLWRWHQAHGPCYRVPGAPGQAACWVVHEPGAVQHVLVRNSANYTKGVGLDRVKLLLGNGIMVSEGDFWARQRRLLQPAFRPRALADFNAMIHAENIALAERLRAPAERGESVDIAAHVSESTLIIVLKAIFGADYRQLVAGATNPFSLLTEQPGRDLRFAARFRRLTPVVDALIEQRLQQPHAGFDFLGHMLAARGRDGRPMRRAALIDEVMTLIVAGHETTASVLAWAWYLVATHAPVRVRLQAEADGVDAAVLRTTGANRERGLAHTNRVIDETLRLYPPGWLLSRRAIHTDEIGRHAIAPGTQLFISPYVLHRHGGYWRAPHDFDPARFERGEPAHRFAYIPFAAGPRHCIGEQMALTELRVNLVTLLRRFTPVYTRDAQPGVESHINLRPREGIHLQLVPR